MYKLIILCLLILSAIFTLLLYSCGSKKAIQETINIKDQGRLVLEPPITYAYNRDSTYVLCLGAGSSKSNPLYKSYCVFDKMGILVSDKRTIHGKVGWYDIETLIIEEVPRVINKRDGTQSVKKYLKIKEMDAHSK